MASLPLARSSELSLRHSHVNGLSHSQSVCGQGLSQLKFTVLFAPRRTSIRAQPQMGNINEGKGIFAPLVVLVRNVIGKQRFNQLRGKGIALHSQGHSHVDIVLQKLWLLIVEAEYRIAVFSPFP